jgi:hypothetical protein
MRSKRQWERDALSRELAGIDAFLAEQRDRLSAAEQSFAEARSEWRTRAGENRSLNMSMQRILSAYLAEAGDAVASRKREVAATQQSRSAMSERLMKTQRLLDGVERHKSRLAKEHEHAELVRQYVEMDAAWLQRTAAEPERRR